MARLGLFAFLAGGAALVLSGCGLLRPASEVRYRVTLEVISDGELRSGSSVWSWRLDKPDLPLATPYNGEFHGEAVAVDLSDGQTLFAVLRGDDGDEGAMQLLPERLFGDIGRDARGEPKQFEDRVHDLQDIASRTGERRVLDCSAQPNWCPMLVTFSIIDDPETVQKVDPLALHEVFGKATKLRRIVVEIVDEPVTEGITTRLPWLERVGKKRSTLIPDPPRYLDEATPIQLLSPGAFSTRLYK